MIAGQGRAEAAGVTVKENRLHTTTDFFRRSRVPVYDSRGPMHEIPSTFLEGASLVDILSRSAYDGVSHVRCIFGEPERPLLYILILHTVSYAQITPHMEMQMEMVQLELHVNLYGFNLILRTGRTSADGIGPARNAWPGRSLLERCVAVGRGRAWGCVRDGPAASACRRAPSGAPGARRPLRTLPSGSLLELVC